MNWFDLIANAAAFIAGTATGFLLRSRAPAGKSAWDEDRKASGKK